MFWDLCAFTPDPRHSIAPMLDYTTMLFNVQAKPRPISVYHVDRWDHHARMGKIVSIRSCLLSGTY